MSRFLPYVVLLVSLFSQGVHVAAQQSDDDAIKAVISAETTTFNAKQADEWADTWIHEAQATRTLMGSDSYESVVGWDKIASVRNFLKANPHPLDVEVDRSDFIIVHNGNLAWVQYDETVALRTKPESTFHSREQRVLRKDQGRWRILSQISIGTDSYKSTPAAIESGLNNNGYKLMEASRLSEALEVFKLNVRLYPDSWNAYDSLGEAYAAAGNKELAIANYEKSVQLNPKNESGKAALQKLRGK
jgi:tetratricopeptide (TPR) repeat protein